MKGKLGGIIRLSVSVKYLQIILFGPKQIEDFIMMRFQEYKHHVGERASPFEYILVSSVMRWWRVINSELTILNGNLRMAKPFGLHPEYPLLLPEYINSNFWLLETVANSGRIKWTTNFGMYIVKKRIRIQNSNGARNLRFFQHIHCNIAYAHPAINRESS